MSVLLRRSFFLSRTRLGDFSRCPAPGVRSFLGDLVSRLGDFSRLVDLPPCLLVLVKDDLFVSAGDKAAAAVMALFGTDE